MLQSRLHKLFDAYIDHFEENNSNGDSKKDFEARQEYFKRIANQMPLRIWQLRYTQPQIIFWELRMIRSTTTRFAV